MLKELNHYENLGSPTFFYELFGQLKNAEQPWNVSDVRNYFYNRVVDDYSIFDGGLPLAEAIGAITIDKSGFITLNKSIEQTLVNERYLSNKLLEMILLSVREDEIFHDIFCSENISYDIIYRLIQIESGAFGFRYANFRQLLINFSFLYQHPDKNIRKFIVNSKYKILFDKELMPEIKRRKIGIDELEKVLEQKQIYGKEAESFVLKYEKERLFTHPRVHLVEIISEYDVSAGYDVVSYGNLESVEYDRFIEVKSFSKTPTFHWSRNEIDVARIKKDFYFLYLVDREQFSKEGYHPLIIQNPYKVIMENPSEWEKRVDSYSITKI